LLILHIFRVEFPEFSVVEEDPVIILIKGIGYVVAFVSYLPSVLDYTEKSVLSFLCLTPLICLPEVGFYPVVRDL
jgi:hypothetical protein